MDKNKVKSFAIWARRSLIAAVSEKANRIGISEGKIEEATAVQGGFIVEGKEELHYFPKSHRDALVSQVREKGFEQVMEEVAYTWFNRFMGLRYMEVNDYLPTGVRILSSSIEGKIEPDVLTKVSEIIDELGLNANEIYDLLDTGDTLDREKAYRIILVKQCNELGKIIPQMFEKISDYTELLLPDNLLEDSSVIRKMVEDIEESDWLEEVEIIGWMYQYYISEKKDVVFADLKNNVKITKENIPAATQLFTPKWIVKYMVENSLGRLWLEGHSNEELQKEWKYYLQESEQEPEVEEELNKIREEHAKLKPEDIKVLDPCMGSGHILVYAFDVLYEIYKTSGYSEREIPRLILQKNLYGLDIDDRAAQLAAFALIMKARHYNRRLFREIGREGLELNLCSIEESNEISNDIIEYFSNGNENLEKEFRYLIEKFIESKEYGSIIRLDKVDFTMLNKRLVEIESENNFIFGDYREIILNKVYKIIKQSEIMTSSYNICVTNPPYMGSKGMSDKLFKYVDINYKKSKRDLSTVLMEKCSEFTCNSGYLAMINIPTWMFLTSYSEFREELINNEIFINLIHLGRGVFGSDFGTVAFVLSKYSSKKFKGLFKKLYNKAGDVESLQEKKKRFFEDVNIFINTTGSFSSIPSMPIVYWASSEIVKLFKKRDVVSNYADVKKGLTTAKDDTYLRLWHEISNEKFVLFSNSNSKWHPITKGGSYRRWYGNNEYVVNWENNGMELKSFKNSVIRNEQYYFRDGITWTYITNGKFNLRIFDNRNIITAAGPGIYGDNIKYLLGYLNSSVAQYLINMIGGQTITYEVGEVANIPIKSVKNAEVEQYVDKCINIAKQDWDQYEQSWDFKNHQLLECVNENGSHKIETIFSDWENRSKETFKELKDVEEKLNKIFIDLYGLSNELKVEIEDKDITIRKADIERDIKSFISYSVGCILGRYSIDSEGLIYAGGDFSDKWNLADSKVSKIEKDDEGNIISDSWVDSRFMPDKDNIIPITEDEYFEDDIVSRFIDFVRTVYGNDTLEENIDFIADSIGRKASETARQAIRRYFIKDFYKDHLKIYQKRPIYWMFESGKNDGFKCLVYMHRYNDQTVAKVRTDYIHTLQRKYESEINRLQLVVDSEDYTAKDRTSAKKKIDRISKQLEECKEYDQVVAHLANEKISIDLDDGVKVNYAKFQDVKVINSKGKEVKMNLLSKI
ncbi:BREX-1 system adenine-specific DNA-methyltransferase PglX [Clostridium butyricum]|uniref:site-specific DNA-methyltransferase (adenine-specific) n=1 Tax=Clostridium butyricum E4 str. BoNT E BL5262 TaxID=632245 RepID=C4IG84_CLOBU|nr:BREX-1 system adenine-specific DNA-methyltransferase PglX [Clostridium butyricum]EDT73862.1 type II restriction enzyme [Clostridium butyricum 5521]EEP54359.1 type II site-specific deoxyribonuclease [Clostridium butyricum E4 str. BoNT E BL5262]NFL31923.1 BREX-1 system adenine-specific DNA-methyltransferase PglX [Clostridium butyricum]NFS19390.1 BREX-1 system adenine-specific DNA-methyltransferase PglX [Clostridium butyricum]